jgi:Mn2+/Fe2+ NRAMP family transporter
LASVVRRHYAAPLLWGACLLLVIGNTVNIAADLGAMGATAQLLTHVPSLWLIPLFTAIVIALLVFAKYARMVQVLKWLATALFAYVGAAFLAHPDWRRVALGTFAPHVVWSRDYLLTFVAIFGTTISPYLFFWQASQGVEQQEAVARDIGGRPARATERELRGTRRDVVTGMFVSNIIMYFIIVTAGATLHVAGKTDIHSASEAATALSPIAGRWASWLFSAGLLGTGLLGVPVLAGSTAYALAEGAAWRRGMDEAASSARKFYGVIVASMLLGMVLDFLKLDAIKLLVWSAVVNGLLAPPLIVLILVVCNNREVMGDHVNGRLLNAAGGFAAVLMSLAAVALIVSWFF